MILREGLSYDDVLLVPQYSDIVSRREVEIGNSLGEDLYFRLPVFSSPMDTVTGQQMAVSMSDSGGLGVIHRYNSIEEQVALCSHIHSKGAIAAAAIGGSGDSFERAHELALAGAQILCVDVAHGHHTLMRKAIPKIREIVGPAIHIMAGNVATKHGFEDLAHWGADSVRCNIGGGSICSTRIETGHGVPGLQTIFDCFRADISRDVKIIADGGIRNSGDIVKALAAGADFVMVGSLLAGTNEAPGSIIQTLEGRLYKAYRGMASKEAQHDWRGKHSSNEGISTSVPCTGPVADILEDLASGIRSGFSYSGARNILELQSNAEFIRQTSSGQRESATHILGRANE